MPAWLPGDAEGFMAVELPVVREPGGAVEAGLFPGQWWHSDGDRIACELCPRDCRLKEGDRGFCFVRQNVGGQMLLTTYGRSTGFCIDPIEKKPLNHFYPGTSVLSFGTAGCNLGCQFCQNWDISKAREVERLSHSAMPEEIAHAAKSLGCHSVAYTYNDPVIWAEYAIDTAKACRAQGVRSVAVTAGYITPQARGPFFEFMDAANVDLKAFTEEFYYRITYSHLQPVLDTLRWMKHETDVWFEITNLVIPDANDRPEEFQQMCDWILEAVGDEVPVHFTAFHPDFRMRDRGNTPPETLNAAREIALRTGLRYAYVGNVNDVERQSTYCPGCRNVVIERNWYELGTYNLRGDTCVSCGTRIAGRFEDGPGTWGRKRQPVDMRQFHLPGLSSAITTGGSGHSTGGPVNTGAVTESAAARVSGRSSQDGAGMSTGRDEASDGNGVKINDSALQWLASQHEVPATVQRPPEPPAPPSEPAVASTASAASTAGTSTGTAPVVERDPRERPTRIPLTAEQREAIRRAAAEVVSASAERRSAQLPDLSGLGVANAVVSGIFVSLKRNGRLRSCMGSFGGTMPLQKTLEDASRRTATADPRFPPVVPCELPYLNLEVWLLYSPERVDAVGEDRVGEIKVGTHGLQIVRGNQRGLLLPGVAVDAGWNAVEFLDNVCIKAGLPPTAWKDPETVLFRFEGNCIKGGLMDAHAAGPDAAGRVLYRPEQMQELRRVCHENVIALARGATPMYYCGSVPDETVTGVSMVVTLPGTGQEMNLARMSIKDPMPLQSTAFGMCEELAAALKRRGFLNGNFGFDLTVAYDPAMHGSVAQPSLDGISTAERGLMISERTKTSWLFDPSRTPEALLAEAAQLCQVTEPVYAMVFSLAFLSTRSRVSYAAVPLPVRGDSERPAAVAGRFYPADVAAMNQMLDDMLAGAGNTEARPCRAAMVPHAGWQFSGRLAASVLRQIQIPGRVIIIGPKHTSTGTDWAVAPHHVWNLPGVNVASDYELAMKLAERIDGLEPDAAAHRAEHGIEVELPILARLAPEAKVVGIAMGGASLERCGKFATQLADVIREMDTPPLLLISSDMNHFATDAETRRLDRMALEAFDRLDEDELFQVCRRNHISMCGMLPAVVVLKTLKLLGGDLRVTDAGYSTSADITGDTSRVVGYAGRLIGLA